MDHPTQLRKRPLLAGPPPLDRFFDDTYDFPRVQISPSVYLIAATPRCGSHYLGHLLFATRQLGAPLEYFSMANYRRWSQVVGSESPVDVLRAIMARRTSASGWFGVQAHWFQLANLSRLKIPRYALDFERVIWVRRRDVIDQAVSLVIALQTGAWTSFHKPSREPIYNYQAIANYANAIKLMELKWAQFLNQTNAPHLSLCYEDIRGNELTTVAHILEWFGLPQLELALSVPLQKQATETNAVWKDRFLCEMRRQ